MPMNDYWDGEEDEEEVVPDIEQTRPTRRARRSRDGQGNWYLLTGLIIGLALGLLIAWVISPVQYVDTGPSSLSAEYKDEHRRIVALAYNADRNLTRARERIRLVDGEQSVQALASQAQRMLANNQPAQEARALAVLAADLSRAPGQDSTQAVAGVPTDTLMPAAESTSPAGETAAAQPTATLAEVDAIQTPTNPPPTPTSSRTPTPRPTATPTTTATPRQILDAPFTLKNKREVCDGSIPAGMLHIEVSGEDGEPLPGVHILITWQDGTDDFYTGLAPEISPGYADFQMTTGILYSLEVGDASEPLNDLKSTSACGLELEFTQQKGE
jgi:hypothetical protein